MKQSDVGGPVDLYQLSKQEGQMICRQMGNKRRLD